MSDYKDKKPHENIKKQDEKVSNKFSKQNKQIKTDEKPKPSIITREEKDKLLKLPFILLAERLKYTKPLQAALKTVYNWTDSTLLTKNELTEFARKWLHGKQS